ncbi:pseudaminic acid cytidylyltransferase [Vibrio ostreicida]|uniref:pseudaminic acid cytidylyltransferase n=1 Tax=Vibrio ostreicida TaxID=526588 RepID=UPI000970F128|nr:pseudaminic acid cytidylyltransferase [Vibrio ostreicida]
MKIAIIPARGGSKRIPRKNIKCFHGKPMIAYSIEAALASECFDRVIVSTDDPEIAQVARSYGAEVPFTRPVEFSDDYATTLDVIHHAIEWCNDNGWPIEDICCLYATAPFVKAEYLRQGYRILKEHQCEFVFSATTFPFPIQRAIKLSSSGAVSMVAPKYEQTRSQDLEETFHDAGQFYWGTKVAFFEKKSIFSPHSRVVLLPRCHVQDIDTPEDWALAEALFAVMN